MAPRLAGKQEIVVHFFCISVQHIRSLLIIVAEAVGYEIPPDDLKFLDEFRHLRSHYEHWYDRLPGKTNEVGLIAKAQTATKYWIRGGLQTDGKDRIIVIEPKKSGPVTHVVVVTNDGMARIERIASDARVNVKERAMERVRAHYTAAPQNIPSPNTISDDLIITVGSQLVCQQG